MPGFSTKGGRNQNRALPPFAPSESEKLAVGFGSKDETARGPAGCEASAHEASVAAHTNITVRIRKFMKGGIAGVSRWTELETIH